MIKDIKQIQEENRQSIIMACNPEAKSYEEALEMEVGFGCKVIISPRNKHDKKYEEIVWNTSGVGIICLGGRAYILESKDKIIGKPLTLDRVLLSLEPYPNNYGIVAGYISRINRKTFTYDFICKYDLTKGTLEEQSEDCQRAINKLLR